MNAAHGPSQLEPDTHFARVVSATTALAALALLLLVAALAVPWGANDVTPVAPASVFSDAELTRAEEYVTLTRIISWVALGVSTLLAAVLGFTRIGARLVPRWTRRRWVQVGVVVSLCHGATLLATLPMSWVIRQRRLDYGLTHQEFAGWIADLARTWVLNAVVTWVGLLLVLWLVRRFQRWWPALAATAAAAFVVLGSYAYPVVVEPVFNEFEPMADSALRTEILRLAEVEKVEVEEVLVADASRRTTTLNAYVSGFGSTKRVVVYDTLLEGAEQPEVLTVVAHELAHARHNDVGVGTTLGALGLGAAVAGLGWLLTSPGLRRRLGVSSLGEPQAVALILACISIGTLLSSPLQAGVSRQMEARADRDALEMTQDPAAFEQMQRTLCLRSLCDPTPIALTQFWFGTHPGVLQRVALARDAQND